MVGQDIKRSPVELSLNRKKSSSVSFGPAAIIFFALRRQNLCHADRPRRDCTDSHILKVTEETSCVRTIHF